MNPEAIKPNREKMADIKPVIVLDISIYSRFLSHHLIMTNNNTLHRLNQQLSLLMRIVLSAAARIATEYRSQTYYFFKLEKAHEYNHA